MEEREGSVKGAGAVLSGGVQKGKRLFGSSAAAMASVHDLCRSLTRLKPKDISWNFLVLGWSRGL